MLTSFLKNAFFGCTPSYLGKYSIIGSIKHTCVYGLQLPHQLHVGLVTPMMPQACKATDGRFKLKWKKRSERRKHCSPEIFALAQTPFPGVQDRQNLINWRRSLPAPTDPVWWRSMHAISSYRGNRHCPPARHKHTQRQDRLQYIAPLASLARSVTSSLDRWL